MTRTIMLLAGLCLAAQAADNAAVAPRAGAVSSTDAITIPRMLSYQGKLTDTAGRPTPNGEYAVTFRLYSDSTGGSAFWTEFRNVQTRSGLFSVQLGKVTPLSYLPWNGNCWLEMQVHPDPVMTPRVRIVSAGYAYVAAVAETAMTAGRAAPIRPLSPGVSNGEIIDNAVTTFKIMDRSIKGIDIALPCSLVSQVGNPYAALHIRAQNTGNGIRIDSAANNGIVVNYAHGAGILVDSSASNGINIYGTANDGIYVARAGTRGIRVGSAGTYGVSAYGNSAGGYFRADLATGVGVYAVAYNASATDTAIHAEGRGIASGGWYTGFDDGEGAPCAVGTERTIIACGSAKVSQISIRYPATFARNIRSDTPVRISLTPKGNPAGMLCVNRTDPSGFSVTVKPVPGWDGDRDVSFDWVAFGTLREPSDAPNPKTPDERTPVKGDRDE